MNVNTSYEIVPSEEALKLINQRLPNADTYLAVARTGTHHLNAYHNLSHELGVVYWAYSCWVNSLRGPNDEPDLSNTIARGEIQSYGVARLIMAALFHDHNHSGGRLTDDLNVLYARTILTQIGAQSMERDFGKGWSQIDRAIACTQFTTGVFPKAPSDFMSKCIRDADLMSIYSNEGRQLLVGLCEEMGTKIRNELDVFNVVANTKKFLTDVTMYTQFGQFMRQHYLEQCLEQFGTMLRSVHIDHFTPVPLKMWFKAAGIDADQLFADLAADEKLSGKLVQ